MVITNLNIGRNGRLGNQLFQAASAVGIGERALAQSVFAEAWRVPFECFQHPLPILENQTLKEIHNNELDPPLVHLDEGKVGYKDISQHLMDNRHLLKRHMPGGGIFNLEGYFQSEKYFNHCRALILEIFKPQEKILEYIEREYSFLKDDIWTSLHVRRGDYVGLSQSHPLNPHPLQEVSYYTEALEELKPQKILVFSDDIEWCKKNFKGSEFKFVEERTHKIEETNQMHPDFITLSDENLASDYTEINIMAACSNNIIANSSFSWWGAWLNQKSSKQVIAPLNWFSPQYAEQHVEKPLTYIYDIIPSSWKII